MKLLAERINPLQLITEGKGAEKKHYLRGLFVEFDSPNRNGRIYRSEFHDAAVKTWIHEKMNENRGYGELDHPIGATISLQNVSHRVVEMWKENSNWFGKSIICDTPMGQIAKGLLSSGGAIGSSSRGVGSVKELGNGVLEVQRDYKLVCPSDLVSDPSAHNALMTGLMEGVEYFWDDEFGPVAEKIKKEVNKMSLNEIEDRKVAMITKFIREIRV
jgi:Prohead core protein serine protease